MNPKLVNLTTHLDDRGSLTEICRDDWEDVSTKLRQVYVVQNYTKDTIRAFHCHNILWDYFTIIKGSAKFILFHYKTWGDSVKGSKFDYYKEFVLSDKKLQMLVVPMGWMHGWRSLENETILLSAASETYNKDEPDEIRIPWDSLGEDIWTTQFK